MKSFVRLLPLAFVVACASEQATETRTDLVYPPVVQTYCGMCHATPEPSVLTRRVWPEKMALMFDLLWQQRNIRLSEEERRICLDFYVENAPEAFAALPPDTSDVAQFFRKIPLGRPVQDSASRPAICNVAVGDLDQNRQPDILVCDAQYDVLSWIHQEGNRGVETPLAELKAPARSEVFDLEGDGDLDIVVALLGQLMPTDELLGQVVPAGQRRSPVLYAFSAGNGRPPGRGRAACGLGRRRRLGLCARHVWLASHGRSRVAGIQIRRPIQRATHLVEQKRLHARAHRRPQWRRQARHRRPDYPRV